MPFAHLKGVFTSIGVGNAAEKKRTPVPCSCQATPKQAAAATYELNITVSSVGVLGNFHLTC